MNEPNRFTVYIETIREGAFCMLPIFGGGRFLVVTVVVGRAGEMRVARGLFCCAFGNPASINLTLIGRAEE